MSLHYGPEWMWDQNRPEAIEARREVEAAYRRWLVSQKSKLESSKLRDTPGNSPATHLRLAAQHIGLFFHFYWHRLRM